MNIDIEDDIDIHRSIYTCSYRHYLLEVPRKQVISDKVKFT